MLSMAPSGGYTQATVGAGSVTGGVSIPNMSPVATSMQATGGYNNPSMSDTMNPHAQSPQTVVASAAQSPAAIPAASGYSSNSYGYGGYNNMLASSIPPVTESPSLMQPSSGVQLFNSSYASK